MTHETLEGELADQKLSGLLVATDLTESDGTCEGTISTMMTWDQMDCDDVNLPGL